jgi:hypothetical protein
MRKSKFVPPRKRRKPKGPAVLGEPLDDAEAEAGWEVTAEDIDAAKAHARRLMPKRLRRILDAGQHRC